jgi:hypothetical protein
MDNSNREELCVNDHWHDVPLDRSSGGEPIGRREILTLMIAASFLARDGFTVDYPHELVL